MAPATAQLSLDGADRLVELLEERRAPVAAGEAARCLFALRSAPAPLVRQLVDEVVRADARLTWRSAGEVALADWEEVASLVDLPLEQAPYVVFDLETTGTRPGVSRIVEVGAVRMHGFEAVETFHRLVDPGVPIPQTITRITGITRPDVRGAPRIGRVLTEFRRFAAGAVLVAHNARFDVGFVDAELSRLRGGRLTAPVIDTVALARRFLEGRLPRMNLGTLAERFDTEVRPCHRALPDAQATAEILAVLLGMAQERGARTVGDALGFSAPIARRARTRRSLARDVPTGPGVYLFRDAAEQVLYVGKASDLRARVRSYFGSGPPRRRVEAALAATERIETRQVGSELEAALLELELILRLRPAANHRAAHPERACYLTLTVADAVPRLAVTQRPQPSAVSVGPLTSQRQARSAASALRGMFGVRSCRPAIPEDEEQSCMAGLLGRCAAPCRGATEAERHTAAVGRMRGWLEGAAAPDSTSELRARMAALGEQHRFEEAAAIRDQLTALDAVARALARTRRAVRRNGFLLAPDLDSRFVQVFACARGRVVGRRRVPRAGDGRLELQPLAAALEAALGAPPVPLEPELAEQARVVAAAFARPGIDTRAVVMADLGGLPAASAEAARLRETVPLRG